MPPGDSARGAELDAALRTFAALPANPPETAFETRQGVALVPPPGAIRLCDLATCLPAWGAAATDGTPEADDKLRAAYLIGRLAPAALRPFAALMLAGHLPAHLPAEALALTLRTEPWQGADRLYQIAIFDVTLLPGIRLGAPDGAAAGDAIAGLFAPVVTLLSRAWRLGPAALWRLVGDALSQLLLEEGRRRDEVERASALALEILHREGSPLHAPQLRFTDVSLPERPDISERFRVRGGCCRYYTVPGGSYCTSCVLRDDESREDRLRAHLRATRLTA
ncbi:(2Fe-2S)-binding protein [Pseudoroseicyclus sp. CXY001]|uniref:(2Fe-2S)-binding protein n=1 Tax=Pseudoroseicyclus sp. CXY001 TaxID=3242492 RepID=UPI0035713A22